MDFDWDDLKANINFRKHGIPETMMRSTYDFSNAKSLKRPKEIKVLKTFRLDPDVLNWLEVEGEKQGMGYQSFLNWFLRKSMVENLSLEERVEKIEKIIYQKAE